MKKICVILTLITAFALNTAVHGAVYSSYGDIETDNNVFSVHFEAHMMPIITDTDTEAEPSESTEDSTLAETSDTVYESHGTDSVTSDVYTEAETSGEIQNETSSDTSNETSGDTETVEKTVFGGEGTVKFSPEELKILSVTPLFGENIGYDLNAGEGFLRFMFYSSAEIKESISMFDIEFEILSVDKNKTVSVILTEGLFSDSKTDTTCEDVVHTVKASGFSQVTTAPPLETVEKETTSTEQTFPKDDTDETHGIFETTIDISHNVTVSTSHSANTQDPSDADTGTSITVMITAAFSVILLTAGAILVSKKIKSK